LVDLSLELACDHDAVVEVSVEREDKAQLQPTGSAVKVKSVM
jgi:hypothetical protein